MCTSVLMLVLMPGAARSDAFQQACSEAQHNTNIDAMTGSDTKRLEVNVALDIAAAPWLE